MTRSQRAAGIDTIAGDGSQLPSADLKKCLQATEDAESRRIEDDCLKRLTANIRCEGRFAELLASDRPAGSWSWMSAKWRRFWLPEHRQAGAAEISSLDEDLELLTLSGSLAAAGSHLHPSVPRRDGHVPGGHAACGCLVRITAEALLALLPALAVLA